MKDCKSNEKSGPVTGSGLNSITQVLKILLSAFNIGQKPATSIPPFLLLAGAELKPGMSGRNLAANIISRMESEAGIPMGDVFADGPNAVSEAMLIASQEQVSHIQQNAKVSTVIKPGAVQVTATGTAGPIPVVVQGANISLTETAGIIQ
jgi:hypothetical protein